VHTQTYHPWPLAPLLTHTHTYVQLRPRSCARTCSISTHARATGSYELLREYVWVKGSTQIFPQLLHLINNQSHLSGNQCLDLMPYICVRQSPQHTPVVKWGAVRNKTLNTGCTRHTHTVVTMITGAQWRASVHTRLRTVKTTLACTCTRTRACHTYRTNYAIGHWFGHGARAAPNYVDKYTGGYCRDTRMCARARILQCACFCI
jgi:hypothetical protein